LAWRRGRAFSWKVAGAYCRWPPWWVSMRAGAVFLLRYDPGIAPLLLPHCVRTIIIYVIGGVMVLCDDDADCAVTACRADYALVWNSGCSVVWLWYWGNLVFVGMNPRWYVRWVGDGGIWCWYSCLILLFQYSRCCEHVMWWHCIPVGLCLLIVVPLLMVMCTDETMTWGKPTWRKCNEAWKYACCVIVLVVCSEVCLCWWPCILLTWYILSSILLTGMWWFSVPSLLTLHFDGWCHLLPFTECRWSIAFAFVVCILFVTFSWSDVYDAYSILVTVFGVMHLACHLFKYQWAVECGDCVPCIRVWACPG